MPGSLNPGKFKLAQLSVPEWPGRECGGGQGAVYPDHCDLRHWDRAVGPARRRPAQNPPDLAGAGHGPRARNLGYARGRPRTGHPRYTRKGTKGKSPKIWPEQEPALAI